MGTPTGFERQGLIQDGEQVWNRRWVWAQACQHRAAHTDCPRAVWRAVRCNRVRPGAACMRDEQSGSWGLCEGLSTVNPRKGPLGGEVTSSVADPNGTRNPKPGTHFLATVPQPVRAPLAGESSSRMMVSSCVSTDQGFCSRKPWREMFFRCFRQFSAQTGASGH